MSDAGDKNLGQARGNPAVRFVVLARPDGEACEPLMLALRERQVEVCRVEDFPGVMVELAEAPSGALFIEDSATWSGLETLLAAVGKYYPAVICRQYKSRGTAGAPSIGPLTDEPAGTGTRTGGVVATEGPVTPMGIRAAPKPTSPNPQSGEGHLGDEDAPPLVSKEELAMLLGRDGGKPGSGVAEDSS